jgi:hypothetical protein
MTAAQRAREAAEAYVRAVDQLETLRSFDLDSPGRVTVRWDFGSSTPGYAALSAAMSEMVQVGWSAMRAQILADAEADVEKKREALHEALQALPEVKAVS